MDQWIGFKGNIETGNHRFSHAIWGFSVDFTLDQSIENEVFLGVPHAFLAWFCWPTSGVAVGRLGNIFCPKKMINRFFMVWPQKMFSWCLYWGCLIPWDKHDAAVLVGFHSLGVVFLVWLPRSKTGGGNRFSAPWNSAVAKLGYILMCLDKL